MKLLAILLCATLSLIGCQSVVSRSHQTTLALRMDDGTCSGTAVGRHVLLTATHCLSGQHLAVNGTPAAVEKVINDGHDHSLVVVDLTFDHWAFVGDEPAQGDEVYIIGNPGQISDIYRHGYVSGHLVKDNVAMTLYDLNSYYGDSGSGIFNSRGQLIAIESQMVQWVSGGYMKLAVSFPLAFTDKQWQDVQKN